MKHTCLKINLNKIAGNCKIINDRCTIEGISVVGVTKGVSGDIYSTGIKRLRDNFFNLNYFGLLSCMNSLFVKRKYIEV